MPGDVDEEKLAQCRIDLDALRAKVEELAIDMATAKERGSLHGDQATSLLSRYTVIAAELRVLLAEARTRLRQNGLALAAYRAAPDDSLRDLLARIDALLARTRPEDM
jgi:hypothetical protein